MSARAESMNEVTRLRTKHLDYGEWEDGDEHYDEGGITWVSGTSTRPAAQTRLALGP